MLISLCIPVHNRTHDLKKIMPALIEAARRSPPVEIVIVDYNSPDDLQAFLASVRWSQLADEVTLTTVKYTGRKHYHMAHARNLTIKAASGEYIAISSADIALHPSYFQVIRQRLGETQAVFLESVPETGVVVCQRQEFIDAGGYDERFEFYGPEDSDLRERLMRRGGKWATYPASLLNIIRTPNEVKIANYRLPLSKREMAERMHPIYFENQRNAVRVANAGLNWGAL